MPDRRAPTLRRANLEEAVVKAGGGVILRQQEAGDFEVALVHRPRREDWPLPKVKLDPGESFDDGALREVEEETGFRCELTRFAGYTEYIDRRGRPKIVAYWVMQVADEGTFSAHAEIDELRWVDVPAALEMLTYPRDKDLLCSLDELSYARSA